MSVLQNYLKFERSTSGKDSSDENYFQKRQWNLKKTSSQVFFKDLI